MPGYVDDLWFLLHHSDCKNRFMLGLTAYFDDSGSDEAAPLVTLGGPLMSRIQFKEFSKRWKKMLQLYRIPEPLHMVDFIRPHGKHIGMGHEMKLSLFRDVSTLIKDHRVFSLSVQIPHVDFKKHLSADVRKIVVGPYSLAFFSAILLIGESSRRSRLIGGGVISYLVDQGSSEHAQLVAAHAVIQDLEKQVGHRQTGALGFDTDDRVPALQVADVIAWASRRKEFKTLTGEFEPLSEILEEGNTLRKIRHVRMFIPLRAIQMVADPINHWIQKKGKIPSMAEFIRR